MRLKNSVIKDLFKGIFLVQKNRNLFISNPIVMDPKEFFLLQCNGLELNRPDITIRYLAIKDIVNRENEDCKGLRMYRKFWHYKDTDLLVDNLTVLVNSFADHGYNSNFFLSCDNTMEIFDGGHRLACALFFGEKMVCVRKTIVNLEQGSMWLRMMNNGFNDEEIDFIRHESDLLVENAINSQENKKTIDKEALKKWLLKEYEKLTIFYKRKQCINLFVSAKKVGFYQSFPLLGINGTRATDKRIEQYCLKDILNTKMDVLDIGCNIGFLDMEISSYVRSITGIEYNSAILRLAKRIAAKLNICNITFLDVDFKEWMNPSHRKYDLILSLDVHQCINLNPQDYVTKLSSFIKPSGFVLFEGHKILNHYNYDEYIDEYMRCGFKVIMRDYAVDDESGKIIWTLLHHDS